MKFFRESEAYKEQKMSMPKKKTPRFDWENSGLTRKKGRDSLQDMLGKTPKQLKKTLKIKEWRKK